MLWMVFGSVVVVVVVIGYGCLVAASRADDAIERQRDHETEHDREP